MSRWCHIQSPLFFYISGLISSLDLLFRSKIAGLKTEQEPHFRAETGSLEENGVVRCSKVTKWNSWTLCAPALCAAVTRCLSLSTCHCPGNYTAAGSPIRSWGRTERPTFRGKATGRGGTVDRSRWTRGRWRDPWSLVVGLDQDCTVTATVACPADDRGPAGAEAGTPPASPWPSESRWRGRSTGCSPWRPRQRTVAGPVLGAASPGRGKRWWSSSFSST